MSVDEALVHTISECAGLVGSQRPARKGDGVSNSVSSRTTIFEDFLVPGYSGRELYSPLRRISEDVHDGSFDPPPPPSSAPG